MSVSNAWVCILTCKKRDHFMHLNSGMWLNALVNQSLVILCSRLLCLVLEKCSTNGVLREKNAWKFFVDTCLFFLPFFFNTGEKPVCFEGLCFVIYGAHLKENGKEEKGWDSQSSAASPCSQGAEELSGAQYHQSTRRDYQHPVSKKPD